MSRVERLEIFDELEEWHLIQGHYCIAYAHQEPPQAEPSGLSRAQHHLFDRFGFVIQEAPRVTRAFVD